LPEENDGWMEMIEWALEKNKLTPEGNEGLPEMIEGPLEKNEGPLEGRDAQAAQSRPKRRKAG
jgi:hypothetical protein